MLKGNYTKVKSMLKRLYKNIKNKSYGLSGKTLH